MNGACLGTLSTFYLSLLWSPWGHFVFSNRKISQIKSKPWYKTTNTSKNLSQVCISSTSFIARCLAKFYNYLVTLYKWFYRWFEIKISVKKQIRNKSTSSPSFYLFTGLKIKVNLLFVSSIVSGGVLHFAVASPRDKTFLLNTKESLALSTLICYLILIPWA